MEDTYIEPADPRDSPEPDTSDDEASIKSTRSCSSYNLSHIHENGRRYTDESYYMPNDETELTRLNILHQIYLIILDNNLTTAPLHHTLLGHGVNSKNPNPHSSPPRILDIGTGPGDWAIEMSAEFPHAQIIASDIGVFDSGLGHLSLPNVDFQLADAQSEWTYHQPFDLVHMRGLSGAFGDWARIYQQAFAHLKPGGYIEVADSDPAADTITGGGIEDPENGGGDAHTTTHTHTHASTTQPGSGTGAPRTNLQTYAALLRAAAKKSGYPRDLAHLNTAALTAAGFVDVRVLERSIPIGLWPDDEAEKTLGKMTLIALLEGLEAYAMRPLTASGDWSEEEVRALCEMVREEVLVARGLRVTVRVVTGRKPVSFAQKRKDVLARAMARVKFFKEKDGFGEELEGEGVEWDFDGGGGGGEDMEVDCDGHENGNG